jgi:hypothetical protein
VIKFQLGSDDIVTVVSPKHVVLARGVEVPTGRGRMQLILTLRRALHPGRYTLTLRSLHSGRWTTHHPTITIT